MARGDAQQFVVEALRSRGASLFAPLVGADDVHLAVRGPEGQYVEIFVMEPEPEAPGRFRAGRFKPKAHVFFVCVVSAQGAPAEAWVLPSGVFERFADGVPGAASRTLDLEGDGDEPLRERLSVYRDRWALISDYSKFRSTLADPVALRMRLALG